MALVSLGTWLGMRACEGRLDGGEEPVAHLGPLCALACEDESCKILLLSACGKNMLGVGLWWGECLKQ